MNRILIIASFIVLTACAHTTQDVRPGVEGVHKVVVSRSTKQEAVQETLMQSKQFCENRKMSAAYVEEKVDYTGSMDESTHQTIDKVTKAATAVGAVLGISSTTGNQMKNSGVVMGSGAAANSVLTDDNAYTSTMTFKCI